MTQPTPRINLVVIGGSFGGLSVLSELYNRARKLDIDISHCDITLVEPRTAFEYIPGTWDLLEKSEKWTLPTDSTYAQALQTIHTNMTGYIVSYDTMELLNDVTIINAHATSISPTHITIRHTLPSGPTSEQVVETIPYDVLFDCTGSISTQPIKSLELSSHHHLLAAFPHFTTPKDLVQTLFQLFKQVDCTFLSKFPPTYHLTLQSLLYLDLATTQLLITHYFPTTTHIQPTDEHYDAYRAISLTAHILRTLPSVLAPLLSTPLPSPITESIKATPPHPHDSILYRFVELQATRCLLSHGRLPSSPLTPPLTPAQQNLPMIKTFNMVGGGVTAVELFGNHLDFFLDLKTRRSLALASPSPSTSPSTSTTTLTPHQLDEAKEASEKQRKEEQHRLDLADAALQPSFHLYTFPDLLNMFPASARRAARVHFQSKHYDKVAQVDFHENQFWSEDVVKTQWETAGQDYTSATIYAFGIRRPTLERAYAAEGGEAKPETAPLQVTQQLLPQLMEQRAYDRVVTALDNGAKVPGLVFVVGDAVMSRHLPPTARFAHASGGIAGYNALLYINQILTLALTTKTTTSTPPTETQPQTLSQLTAQMYTVDLTEPSTPLEPSAAIHFGKFGGVMACRSWNFTFFQGPYLSGLFVIFMKNVVRELIMSVLTKKFTPDAVTWNIVEVMAGSSDKFMWWISHYLLPKAVTTAAPVPTPAAAPSVASKE